jgi:hypothetical protein
VLKVGELLSFTTIVEQLLNKKIHKDNVKIIIDFFINYSLVLIYYFYILPAKEFENNENDRF